MRRAALFLVVASSAVGALFTQRARADCGKPTAPCVDAEPLWQSPAAVRLNLVSDARALRGHELALGLSLTERFRPAVLNVPSPNQLGREVYLINDALSLSLAARFGVGRGFELTALAAGLSQRGAGIKGVTSQSAPAIDSPVLQDPRVGFGYALPPLAPHVTAKLRFEAKLPLGHVESFAGERSFVASPSVALSTQRGGAFAGLELGVRLRRPSELYGLHVGSQALLAGGGGYEFAALALSFALELYLLPSLVPTGSHSYLPAEWLLTTGYAPKAFGGLSFGVGAGGGLPLSGKVGGAQLGFGVPSYRALFFLRFTPRGD